MNKTLKNLIKMGRSKKDVQLYGQTWTMHVLDTQEHLAATNSTSEYDNLTRVIALRVSILSHAIDSVNGEPLGSAGEARDALSRLQVPIINALYNEYDKMMVSQQDKFDSLKNDKDTEESTPDVITDEEEDDIPGL